MIGTKFRQAIEPKTLATLIRLRVDEGQKWTAVRTKVNLGHSTAEYAVQEELAERAGLARLEPTAANAAYARDTLRLSWGLIAVWMQIGEGPVARLYADGANKVREGQRIGHGGRFKYNDPDLYVGELKPTGTIVTTAQPKAHATFRDNAFTQRLTALEPAALKGLYEKYTGQKADKGWTKAKLAIEIRKASEAKKEAKTA